MATASHVKFWNRIADRYAARRDRRRREEGRGRVRLAAREKQGSVRQAKLARSSRCKSGPGKGQRPPGSECCAVVGDGGSEAYTAIMWGGLLSRGAPGDRQEVEGESPIRRRA